MTHLKSGVRLAAALMAAALAMALPAQAASKPVKACHADPIVNKIDKRTARDLAAWLEGGAKGDPVPYRFKVGANVIKNVVCKLNAEGLRCYDSLVSWSCPKEVEVETPGGNTTVPVECTGPDGEGVCDCDFAQR